MRRLHWPYIKQKLREDIVALPHFFRNPVQGMRTLPHWDWPTIIILQAGFAATCSVIANLIERDLVGTLAALIVAPVTSLLFALITSGFFYYVFMFFFKREITFRLIYLNVLFASIPLILVGTVYVLLPPLILIGSAAGLCLLYVGFVDNFALPRQPLRRLLIGLFAMHVIYWGFQQVQTSSRHKTLRQRATPETLDILERELKSDE